MSEPLTQSRIDEIAALASAGDLTGITAEEVAFICADNKRMDAAWAHSHNQAMANGAARIQAYGELQMALDALGVIRRYHARLDQHFGAKMPLPTPEELSAFIDADGLLGKHGRKP